jgi:peptidoglycan/LPS O-acetylase OafA/YrhL
VATAPQAQPGQESQAVGPEHLAYRPAIDGLRAVAVMLVVLFHAGMPGLANGYVGVDVFFVISGFLITSILLRERLGTGRIGFTAFYARRMRRLLPVSLLVLAVTAVAYRLVATPLDVEENRMGFAFSALYLANWYFMAQSQDYFAAEIAPSPVMHYWSLGVEEQFYLVWPLLLAAILAIAVFRGRRLAFLLTALALGATWLSLWLEQSNATTAYFSTAARAYQLLAGAALAAWLLAGGFGRWPVRTRAGAANLAILVAGGLIAATIVAGDALTPWQVGLLGVIATVLFLAGMQARAQSRLLLPMQSAVAVQLGRWSYSTYLWHWPVLVIGALILPLMDPEAPWLPRVTVAVVVTLTLAGASYALVERPGQRLSLSMAWQRRSAIALGLAASVAVLGLSLGLLRAPQSAAAIVATAQAVQQDAEDGVATIEVAQAPEPVGTNDPSGLPAPPGGASISPRAGVATRQPRPSTVMLIGDSHAEMWRPGFLAAAKGLGFTGIVITESGCPWMQMPAISDRTGKLHRCDQTLWKPVLEAARKYRPDVVILASRSVLSRRLLIDGETVLAPDPRWRQAMSRGIDSSLRDIEALTDAIVLLEPYPMTRRPMVACLSTGAQPASCDLPAVGLPGTAEVERKYRDLAATLSNVHSVDLDEAICPSGTCLAEVDGLVTMVDNNHLTEAFAARLVPQLLKGLADAGVVVNGKDGIPVA